MAHYDHNKGNEYVWRVLNIGEIINSVTRPSMVIWSECNEHIYDYTSIIIQCFNTYDTLTKCISILGVHGDC